jgi:response regulator RpfG family c-di-GMP phosphodiesterase
LLVDDDAGLRELIRTTFHLVDVDVDEACSTAEAERLLRARRPDVVVLDVRMPGESGLDFCRRLKADAETQAIPVVILSGSLESMKRDAAEAGADAALQKPFSPLELLGVVERLAGGLEPVPLGGAAPAGADAQLLLYARDLRNLLEVERRQRAALENAYRDTVRALAGALESKDFGTRAHSQRVAHYALELIREVDADLAHEPGVEYGFVLHDVGKIGIPDAVLQKPGPLDDEERALMQTHTTLGEQMLSGIPILNGCGLEIVRSHHERWDGRGYPDGLAGPEIPVAARAFAVADALDAMTSDRPYRGAQSWDYAGREIDAESGTQFDPAVVAAFRRAEPRLRAVHHTLARAS